MATTATPMATKRVPLHSANLLLLLAISSSAYAVQNNLKQWDKNSATFHKAYTLLLQHGASLDVELFEEHPAEYQAYLLGSYSAQAYDYLLAIEWLKRAYADVEKLNEFTQQSVLYQLGYSYAQLGQLAESETWYRRAIAKGSAVEQRDLLQARAQHLLPELAYFDDQTAEIVLTTRWDKGGQWQSITATTTSPAQL
ncbi:hypothetical protein VCSRO179_2735 [Vibrio cholerae]|nr:hypothetical protein VCSRO179_2735 [Vibrio cholerae]